MASTAQEPPPSLNLPNQLTAARLVLSIVLFVLIALKWYATSLVLFLVAVSTDWLDGYLARKRGLITVLGRILDPFADKVLICGTYIFLVAEPASQVAAWMVVVIVARELLVTALRSFVEQQGTDFSAAMAGKLKMVLQCAAAALSLAYLAWPADWLVTPLLVALWAAVLLTLYSGATYVRAAVRLLGGKG